MSRVIVRALWGALIAAFVMTTSADAIDAAGKCTNAKRKSAGKTAEGALKCVAKASDKGLAVDPACLTKLSTKLVTDFGKAEAKGGCLTPGDASAVQSTVDACVQDVRVRMMIGGDPLPLSKCNSGKLKGAGKLITKTLGCHDTALKKALPVAPACLAKADEGWTKAFAKANVKGDCTRLDDGPGITADLEECLTNVLDDVTAPTSTTTTTTSTTTTTVPGGSCDSEAAALAGITAAHNDVRDSPSPTPVPALDDLCYDADLETYAQAWANGCTYGHNPASPYGENIYAAAYTGSPPPGWNPPVDAVTSWASEAADYNYSTNTCSGVCGHYTQIVWRESERMGCGLRVCTTNSPFGPSFPTWTFVVCSYDPPGNDGSRPY